MLARTNVKQALIENTHSHTCTQVILQVEPISLAVPVALETQQVGSQQGWAASPLII